MPLTPFIREVRRVHGSGSCNVVRKEFPKSVVESVLIKCRRHCCVCGVWCGQKIEIHHIESPGDSSQDNAIPVCFNCHAEIVSYNPDHPKGRRYTSNELRKLRDDTFKKFSFDVPDLPEALTEYGRGFHAGAEWTQRIDSIKDIWRFISCHGDFAIEILIPFETEDTHSMMDETLFAEVDTGTSMIQSDGYSSAWSSGQVLGMWDVDGNHEVLFLTDKGRLFRQIVFKTPELKSRFTQLKLFWDNYEWGKPAKKPEIAKSNERVDFPPGVMNWLQMEINHLVRLQNREQLYVILSVTPQELELRDIETGRVLRFTSDDINDVELDQNTNELVLALKIGK